MRAIRLFQMTLSVLLVLILQLLPASAQTAQMSTPGKIPNDWRQLLEGVDGYPAGPMLEIALRRTPGDKLEMFRWRSEFISMLSAQPGPLVEREWESIAGIPENEGAGTWTGMTWWDNQQSWHDMANMLFPHPVTANWLQTINMTLVFVKPLDADFDLHTLAQSGDEVLELGILAYPENDSESARAAAQAYLETVEAAGANAYNFDVYPNPMGFDGPFTAAYKQNGMPAADEGEWFVYMVSYPSEAERDALHQEARASAAFAAMQAAVSSDMSDIQIMKRSTSKVCCKANNMCSLDPGECEVSVLGMGDTWAGNCNQCPRPCETGYGICSNLSPQTCTAVGGKLVMACAAQ